MRNSSDFRVGGKLRIACFALVTASLTGGTSASAQFFDPRKDSFEVLLRGPADGVHYYRTRERVAQLVSEKDGATAEPLAEWLTSEYPRDASNWHLLAEVKTQLGKHIEAARAYEREGQIAGWDPEAAANAAASYVAGGDRGAAMAILRTQIVERRTVDKYDYYDAPRFASLRDDPEFRALTGHSGTPELERVEGWRRDIDALLAEVRRINPDYRDTALPEEFIRRSKDLRSRVGDLTDEQIVVQLNYALASLHQGHTQIISFKGSRVSDRTLPVRFFVFPDGIYVQRAAPDLAQYLGAKVLAIGGVPALDALRRTATIVSGDGDMEYVWQPVAFLGNAAIVKGLGLSNTVEKVRLTLQMADGTNREVDLATRPGTANLVLDTPAVARVPISSDPRAQYHQLRSVPGRRALYILFNQVLDDKDETLEAFGRRVRATIARSRPEAVIVDMRANAGGSTALYPELLRALIGFSDVPGNKLFVIIGRRTYSAAGNFITDLERLGKPIFVGEPSSECCRLNGDASSIILPYSRVKGIVTGTKWNLSTPWDTRREIVPQLPVQLTANAYFSGRDPALEAIYAVLDSQRRRHR